MAAFDPALQEVARQLGGVLEVVVPRLRELTEEESAEHRYPGSWSRKQVLGHLVDSATNNLHRLVRARIQGELVFPGYEQEKWVTVEAWEERPWGEVVDLFLALNRHLAHLIARLTPEAGAIRCRIGDGEPVTLAFVAEDYVRHLRHHVQQILEPEAAIGSKHERWA
jgi:hypothetical protein